MTEPVKFELAKLLKEKGFDEKSFGRYYTLNGKDWTFTEACEYFKIDDEISIGGKFTLLAPTIAEVVMWLYEKHGIWISVERYSTLFRPYAEEIDNERFGKWEGYKYNSPTEAYEAVIEYVLKNLI